MSTMSAVFQEYRMPRNIRRLQPGCHFSSMERITVLVRISRDNHGRWIGSAIVNPVIGRVLQKRGKVALIVCSSEFFFPDMCMIEQVVPQHIEHRHHANHGAEQVRSLRHGSSYKQTRVRPTEDGEFLRLGAPSFNQPFRGGYEVIARDLPILSFGCIVPSEAEFRSAPDVRQGEQTALLDQEANKDAELWGHRDAVAPIRSHNRGM